jgi:CBS domain-containing protein
MFLAKDIMTVSTISVSKNNNVKAALDLLAEHNISGLPVVDDEKKVVGIISGSDILRYSHQKNVVPKTSSSFWVSPYTESDDIAIIRNGFEVLHRTTIEQVMTKKIFTVKEDTPVSDIAKLMISKTINRVPVVDDAGVLLGIISRADLVKSMAGTES